MTTQMMREEYTRICDNLFRFIVLEGYSETAPVIQDLRAAAAQLAKELGIEEDEDYEG